MGAVGNAVTTSNFRFKLASDEKRLSVNGVERAVSRHEMNMHEGSYVIYFCPLDFGEAFAVIRAEQRPDTLLKLDWTTTTCFAEHSKTIATLWMVFAAYGKQSAKA